MQKESTNSENLIPKKIHLVWNTKDIPPMYSENIASILKYHQNWEIIIWTHEEMDEYVNNCNKKYYEFYKELKFQIQKCDFFKLLIVFEMGGVYLDLDVTLVKSFDALIYKTNTFFPCEKVLSQQQLSEYGDRDSVRIGYYAFGSIPNHPFFQYFLDKMLDVKSIESNFEDKNNYIINSTGPGLLTISYHDFIKKFPYSDISILYPTIFTKSACGCGSFKYVTSCCIGSFGFHQHYGAWRI